MRSNDLEQLIDGSLHDLSVLSFQRKEYAMTIFRRLHAWIGTDRDLWESPCDVFQRIANRTFFTANIDLAQDKRSIAEALADCGKLATEDLWDSRQDEDILHLHNRPAQIRSIDQLGSLRNIGHA